MPKSLLIKSPTTFVGNSRPPLTRDPIIRPGSKFLFDFTDPRCHPGGVIIPGSVSSGTTFLSLDVVPVPAVVAGTGISINADGSLEFVGTTLNIGTVGQFNLYPNPYEVVYGMYFKFPAVGYITSNYQPLMINGSNANDSHVYIDSGVGGLSPRAQWGSSPQAVGSNPQPPSVAAGALVQHAVRVDPTVQFAEFRAGVQAAAATGGPSATITDQSTRFLRIGGGSTKFTLYRAFMTDIDASLAQETAWNFGDADKLTAAQQILRDYQFCTNQLAAAPKTPFA